MNVAIAETELEVEVTRGVKASFAVMATF